jgi:prepilin-type N-terminal cleavage/methylation domain-containing protein
LNSKGFTLIELLVALVILLAALSSTSLLHQAAGRSHVRALKLSRTLYEARRKMTAASLAPASAELEVIMIEVPPVKLYSLRGKE